MVVFLTFDLEEYIMRICDLKYLRKRNSIFRRCTLNIQISFAKPVYTQNPLQNLEKITVNLFTWICCEIFPFELDFETQSYEDPKLWITQQLGF
jgi:hypothetical protein